MQIKSHQATPSATADRSTSTATRLTLCAPWGRLCGVTLVALAVFTLYVHTLGKQGLWFDEGLSVAFAARPLPQLMRTLIYEDLHPPLYYLLLHFWMMLAGDSEQAVRLPSVIAAVLLVPLASAVASVIWGPEPSQAGPRTASGLVAAALVGTSSFVAYYAQETRMYSLAAALSLAATWAYLQATCSTGCRWWAAFSALLAASLYTQYMSALVVPAYWVYALTFDRKSWPRTLRYTLLAGLLYLPWAFPAYLQLGRLLRTPDYWVHVRIDPTFFLRAMWSTFLPKTGLRWGLVTGAVIALMATVLAARRGFKFSDATRRAALALLSFLIPLGLTYVAVRLAPKFATRYAITAAAPLYICVAVALYALLRWKLIGRVFFALLVIGAVLVSLRSALAVVEGRENRRDDARGLAAYLTENVKANDVLLLVENAPYALQYYYPGPAPWYGLHVGQDFPQAAYILNALLETRPSRVWLILWHQEFADPTDTVVTELMRVGREVDIKKQFFGYELRAFDIQDYQQPIAAYPQPETAIHADFSARLRLLGFDRFTHDRGQLHYVLYWQAQQPLERNYSLTLSFQDQDGNAYLRQDQALSTPYFLPPVWPLHTPIRGRVDVILPADLPPLTYRVSLQVLDPESQRNLDLVDAHGIPLGQTLLLEELTLSKSALVKVPPEITNLLHADMGDGLQLLGFKLASVMYSQGDTLWLTLWWQSASTPVMDHLARFRLLDSKRSAVWTDERLIVPAHPTTHWQAGEVNRAIYRLMIPPDLAGGEYSLQAGIGERLIPLTLLHVVPRQHRYDVPSMQQSLGVQFEQSITLLGYDLHAPAVQPGKTITITLYWQAKQQVPTSYKVSVQMLSTDLRIIAQDDSIPARWIYPTTAWLPGEVVTDEHVLTIAPQATPGSHALIVVLYNEQSMQRLRVEQSGKTRDHVILTNLHVAL